MLDTDTKRRIDTARDILVGKVPDPKSQVEQITIALIYKFMDDMDAESEEFGGVRKFFAGEFARYGWARLMHSGLGGFETLNLYAEAIAKMPENPGIPLLFRNIFKNAYLPYRDPETLKMFLKVIDEFSYDHSERLGDAFEYLLSVLGSQGDAGQFRTPRHIIDFMVEVVDPKKNETCLDPACGTAGFLISSYKHILKANTDAKGNSTLTPDEKGRLAQNFRGYDISPDMVRLSLVNMYLHGFTDPHIYEYDTLTSQDRWNDYADVILANPPFMSPKGGIKPHNRFSVQSKRSEVLFVDYMAEHLTPGGRAGIIVPEGIIFQSQTAYRDLRKMLVDTALVAVVSLPAGVFQPYSGVKTSILILDKSLAKKTDAIAFFKVENDGFGLGAQRREIDKNDLPETARLLREWMDHGIHGTHGRTEKDMSGSPSVFSVSSVVGNCLIVPKEKVAANGDYNLSGERYREGATHAGLKWRLVPIEECCEVRGGKRLPMGEQFSNAPTNHPYIRVTDFSDQSVDLNNLKFISEEVYRQIAHYTISSADVYISIAGTIGLMGTVPESLNGANLTENAAKLVFDASVIDKRFLSIVGNADPVQSQIRSLTHAVGVPKLALERIKTLRIPLPPLEVQKEIVEEIEGYQKVIDGARAVLDNYRPHIPIHPDWPMGILADVCTLISGQHIDKEDYNTVRVGVDYLTGPSDFGLKHPVATRWTSNPKVFAAKGDILMTVKGSGLGSVNILDTASAAISRQLMAIRVRDADPEFIYVLLLAKYDHIQSLGGGAAIPGITREHVLGLEIPLPPLGTQQAIVAEIEAEQALVAANRELIARFEKKIQATLARVWGEDKPALGEERL